MSCIVFFIKVFKMSRTALISRHIVYMKARLPIYGIILVEGEFIHEIIVADSDVPVSDLAEKFRDWNPVDLEDFFISPGIIDINVRREWDTYEFLTKSALAGGVTMIVEENSLHYQSSADNEFYCDVGNFETVSSVDEVRESCSGVLGFKAYLFPPNSSTKAAEDLESLIEAVECTNLPLVLDVIKPSMRLFNEASPYHFLPLEERLSTKEVSDSKVFAAAFPDEADDSENENEELQIAPHLACTRSASPSSSSEQETELQVVAEFPEIELSAEEENLLIPNEHFACRRQHYRDIFSDLDMRVQVYEQSIESLSRVEQFTYSRSGSTVFDSDDNLTPKLAKNSIEVRALFPSFSEDSSTASQESLSPTTPITPLSDCLSRLQKRRPSQINIEKKVDRVGITQDNSQMYMFFLANFPGQWEDSGVNTAMQAIKTNTCKVHISCLSSASAVNRVRKAQKSCNVTCEVAASCLYFTDCDVEIGDTRFKNCPPIRTRSNFNLLWDLLKMKGITSVTSQHRGIHPMYKNDVKGSMKRALNGMNTLGFTLQQIWTKLRRPISSHHDLEHYIVRLAKWLSLQPAKILGIDKTRGSIESGKLADFVIWNPHELINVKKSASDFNETCTLIGAELYGSIHKVMLRGKFVLSNSKFSKLGRRVYKSDFRYSRE